MKYTQRHHNRGLKYSFVPFMNEYNKLNLKVLQDCL